MTLSLKDNLNWLQVQRYCELLHVLVIRTLKVRYRGSFLGLRQITLSGSPPDLGLIWGALLSGIIILTLGWTCFHLWRHQFMDLL